MQCRTISLAVVLASLYDTVDGYCHVSDAAGTFLVHSSQQRGAERSLLDGKHVHVRLNNAAFLVLLPVHAMFLVLIQSSFDPFVTK